MSRDGLSTEKVSVKFVLDLSEYPLSSNIIRCVGFIAMSSHPKTAETLLDEEESRKLIRWDHLKRPLTIGLQLANIACLKKAFKVIDDQRYDSMCSNLFPDDQLYDIVHDSSFWGPDSSWEKKLFPNLDQNVILNNNCFEANGYKFQAEHFFIPMLSNVDLDLYDTKVLFDRITSVLCAQIKSYCKLGVKPIVFEIDKIPREEERLERLLATLLRKIRDLHARQWPCVLVVKFDLKNDNLSRGYCEWFQRFQKSCFETERIRPAITLRKSLPSDESINEWLKMCPAFVFVDTDVFETGNGRAPELAPDTKTNLVKFLEIKTQPVVHAKDEQFLLRAYSSYLRHLWREVRGKDFTR